LDAYVHYGKTEQADLYGDILNNWSPQEEAWVQWWNTTTNWLNKNETFCNVSIEYIHNMISSVCEWKHKLTQVHFFQKSHSDILWHPEMCWGIYFLSLHPRLFPLGIWMNVP
jgi:hypothetical protein